MPSPCPKGRRGAPYSHSLSFFHPRSQAVFYLGEEEEERHTVNGNWPERGGGREGGMCVEDVPWADIICP